MPPVGQFIYQTKNLFLLPIVLALEGEAFCKNEELGLDEDQMHMCFRQIKHFMPQALHVVGRAMHENARHICRDWFHGICHHE